MNVKKEQNKNESFRYLYFWCTEFAQKEKGKFVVQSLIFKKSISLES